MTIGRDPSAIMTTLPAEITTRLPGLRPKRLHGKIMRMRTTEAFGSKLRRWLATRRPRVSTKLASLTIVLLLAPAIAGWALGEDPGWYSVLRDYVADQSFDCSPSANATEVCQARSNSVHGETTSSHEGIIRIATTLALGLAMFWVHGGRAANRATTALVFIVGLSLAWYSVLGLFPKLSLDSTIRLAAPANGRINTSFTIWTIDRLNHQALGANSRFGPVFALVSGSAGFVAAAAAAYGSIASSRRSWVARLQESEGRRTVGIRQVCTGALVLWLGLTLFAVHPAGQVFVEKSSIDEPNYFASQGRPIDSWRFQTLTSSPAWITSLELFGAVSLATYVGSAPLGSRRGSTMGASVLVGTMAMAAFGFRTIAVSGPRLIESTAAVHTLEAGIRYGDPHPWISHAMLIAAIAAYWWSNNTSRWSARREPLESPPAG